MNFALFYGCEQMSPANLCDGHQIRHSFKIVGREICIASRLDFLQSLIDFRTEFLLAIPVLGQFPEPKC